MSADLAEEIASPFTARAVKLMKEYGDKLQTVAQRASDLFSAVAPEGPPKGSLSRTGRQERDDLVQLMQKVEPAAAEFARLVSGQVESGNLGTLEIVELRLRLAEFEHNLAKAGSAVKQLRSLR